MGNIFGYTLSPSATMNVDEKKDKKFQELKKLEPDVSICMSCGSCAGSCTAGTYTSMNLRRVILFLQRGKIGPALSQVGNCMLCGKCNIVCPRGINTRHLILKIQEIYREDSVK